MNWFYNLKTARKLALGFGLCLSLAVLVGTVSIMRMAQMYKISQSIISDSLAGVEALAGIQANARQFRTVEYRHALSSTPAEWDAAETDMNAAQNDTDKALTLYQGTVLDPVDKQNIDNLQAEWQKYVAMKSEFLAVSHSNDDKKCAALLNGPMKDQFSRVKDQLTVLMDWNKKHGEDYSQKAESAYNSAKAIIIGLLALAVLLGSLIAIITTRYMTSAMSQISGRLRNPQYRLYYQSGQGCGGSGTGRPDGQNPDGV